MADRLASPSTSEPEFLDLPRTITNVQDDVAHGASSVNVEAHFENEGVKQADAFK